MIALDSFRVGETYTNDQIRFTLDLENLGGIRPSLDATGRLRHVAVMTAEEGTGKLMAENPYRDRIEGNVLLYTAQGRKGDQALAGRNKRLVEQYEVPTPFYGFANVGRQTYRFLGLLELLRHYQENQADVRRNLRKVWVFEFLIHDQPEIVPVGQAATISASLIAESRFNNAKEAAERDVEAIVNSPPGNSAGLADLEMVRSSILRLRPVEFELFVKTVLEHSGFADVSVTPASGDGGIDVNAYVDESDDFFQGTHVQAQVKRWRRAVGSPEINSFRGALSNTAKGIFVTTSHFTRAAIAEARHAAKPSVALLDGERFASLVMRKCVPLT